jgi:hypothetical protein
MLLIFGFAWVDLDHHPPIYSSLIAGMTDTHCYAYLLVEMGGITNFFPGLASNHDSSHLCLPSSWDYKQESLSPAHLSFR